MGDAGLLPSPDTASNSSGRWAAAQQPSAVGPDEKAHATQRYRAKAVVGKWGTGKAVGTFKDEWRWLQGPTASAAEQKRDEFVAHYLAKSVSLLHGIQLASIA